MEGNTPTTKTLIKDEMYFNTEVKILYQLDKKKWQGGNWIRDAKRAKIYERDNYECGYCGKDLSDEKIGNYKKSRQLDHIIGKDEGRNLKIIFPNEYGEDKKISINHESNLITCCGDCNKMKKDKPLLNFLIELESKNMIDSVENKISEMISKVTTPLSRGTK